MLKTARKIWHHCQIIKVRTLPWLCNSFSQSHYTHLTERALRQTQKSDVLFILGSGYSVNDISPNTWNQISKHDTMSFNWFLYQNFVNINYHLIKEICPNDFDPSIWKPKINEYTQLIHQNTHYAKTIFLVQENWRAINGNRIIGRKLLPSHAPIFRFHNRLPGKSEKPSSAFSEGLAHDAGTLTDCVNFAYIMDWKKIVLVGIDLYDRRYFWLNKEETRDSDQIRGAKHTEQHNMANKLVQFLGKWRTHFNEKGKELYVHNPRSLLAQKLPIYTDIPATEPPPTTESPNTKK